MPGTSGFGGNFLSVPAEAAVARGARRHRWESRDGYYKAAPIELVFILMNIQINILRVLYIYLYSIGGFPI